MEEHLTVQVLRFFNQFTKLLYLIAFLGIKISMDNGNGSLVCYAYSDI